MKLKVLIAEPNVILRANLCALIAEDTTEISIYEAVNEAGLIRQFLNAPMDFLIINQILLSDIAVFPCEQIIIIATEPDLAHLKQAYLYGARGYISVQPSHQLLTHILTTAQQTFTLDPLFTPWAMDFLFKSPLTSIREDVLTRREREIVKLLREGYDRKNIAHLLSISESTLKTHIKNIARKRKTETYICLESQVLGGKRQHTHA